MGIGCRFPGASGPAATWALFRDGRDAIGPVPRDRWDADALYDPDPDAPGRSVSRHGGFLEDVDRFDAAFFGVTPREAARMDPQQRLVLEVGWEALEDAAVSPRGLAGSATGVFVGACSNDYARLHPGLAHADAYDGPARSSLANRLSALLDLRGPSLVVDTACSSSLVAVHLASASLRAREIDLALAGGVQLHLAPDTTVTYSKRRLLAADGRCKAFDARADGFVRGEGCGVLVLERLSDALANGHPVWGVVRGSAVNQDGRSDGLPGRSVASQADVVRAALRQAGLRPEDLGYVEAHGTGSATGDPIEVAALAAVFGTRTGHGPVWLGSAKTNLGHLDAAAGVAGLIKALLAVRHGQVPQNLHFLRENPAVPFDGTPFRVPVALVELRGSPRRAGVSAFGLGGTNAHVVVEQAPDDPPVEPARRQQALVLSAADPEALDALAERLADVVGEHPLADVAATLALGRAPLRHRLVVVASDPATAARRLRTSTGARGEDRGPGRIAFLFTGQGAQHAGMGRALYQAEPAYRRAFELAELALARVGFSLLDAIATGDVADTAIAQPTLFALQTALAATWQAWGIVPDGVIGHGAGELAAACVAGVFDLDTGARLVVERGERMRAIGPGGMLAVAASEAAVSEVLAAFPGLELAATNGPAQVVVAGPHERLAEAGAALGRLGDVRRLDVSHAFHTAAMEPMLDGFEAAIADLPFRPARIPMPANLAGDVIPGLSTARYWRDQVRGRVRFGEGMDALVRAGFDTFVEIGPHPALLPIVRGREGLFVPTLRRETDDVEQMLAAAGALWVRGAPVDWRAISRGRRVRLPTYPWRRERHWYGHVRPAPVDDGWRAWLHHRVWRPRGTLRVGTGGRPPLSDPPVATAPAPFDRYEGLGRWLDDLASAWIGAAAARLGEPISPGRRTSVDAWLARGVRPHHRRLVARLLAILAEDGVLRADGDGFVGAEPSGRAQVVQSRWPELASRVALVDRCGEALPDVLRGVRDPREVLSPASGPTVESVERDSPFARHYVALVAEVIGGLADAVPPGRLLRVLEVGGGDGSTTAAVLEWLGDRPYEYVFTDVSPQVTRAARARLRDRPGVRVATLDLDADPVLGRGQFDVVLAANGVHATASVARSLGRIRGLLAPGGRLVLLEPTGPERWRDLVAGLHPGWWSFEDPDLRPDHPLLPPKRWTRALLATGFDDVRVLGLDPRGRQAVIVARADGAPTPAWRPPAVPGRVFLDDGHGSGRAVAAAIGARRVIVDDDDDPSAELVGAREVVLYARHDRLRLALRTIRALGEARLWIVTEGAQGDDGEPDAAPLWGLGRTLAVEQPERFGGLVDLDPEDPDPLPLARHLAEADGEPEVRFRGGDRYVSRVVRSEPSATTEPLRTDGTWLVVGGLGGVGLEVARRLADRGIRELVLVGRRAPTADVERELGRWDAQVHVRQVDVADADAIGGVLDELRRSLPPLRGVVQAAADDDDTPLARQAWDRLAAVLALRTRGARNLHELTLADDLDRFVVFSSLAGLVGTPGRGAGAAAAAFLDQLVLWRRARGLPGTAIGWGAETGSRAAGALAAFDAVLDADPPYAAVLPVDWRRFEEAYPPGVARAPFAEVFAAADGPPADPPLRERVLAASASDAAASIARHLTSLLRRTTGREVGLTQDFQDVGLDSLMAVELGHALERDLDLPVHPRDVLARPTIGALSAWLADALRPPGGEPPAEPPPTPAFSSLTPLQAPERGGGPVFLLSSPRSGSTLLRVMLAGHPGLFAPPELHLLPFAAMGAWDAELGGSFLTEGLQRALMELRGLAAAEAAAAVGELVASDAPMEDVYALLVREAAPRRLVVKTPSYASSLATLARAERMFRDARYVHLARHPASAMESVVRMRPDKSVGGHEAWRLAEETWATSHRNLAALRASGDAARHLVVRYEDLVRRPADEMRRLCAFLGLPYAEELVRPYDGDRMTDGVRLWSLPVDDPNFRSHDRIVPELADAWRDVVLPFPLQASTVSLARDLGYEVPGGG